MAQLQDPLLKSKLWLVSVQFHIPLCLHECRPQKDASRWNDYSILPLGVNECANMCMMPCSGLGHSCFMRSVPGIGSVLAVSPG